MKKSKMPSKPGKTPPPPMKPMATKSTDMPKRGMGAMKKPKAMGNRKA